jgi:hypothetical protein
VVNFIFGEVSQKLINVNKRHKFLSNRLLQGLSKIKDGDDLNTTDPLLKIFGTRLPAGNFVVVGYEMDEEREQELKVQKMRRKELREKYFKKYKWVPSRAYQNPTVYVEKLHHMASLRTLKGDPKAKNLARNSEADQNIELDFHEIQEDKPLHLITPLEKSKAKSKKGGPTSTSKFQERNTAQRTKTNKATFNFSEMFSEENSSPVAGLSGNCFK